MVWWQMEWMAFISPPFPIFLLGSRRLRPDLTFLGSSAQFFGAFGLSDSQHSRFWGRSQAGFGGTLRAADLFVPVSLLPRCPSEGLWASAAAGACGVDRIGGRPPSPPAGPSYAATPGSVDAGSGRGEARPGDRHCLRGGRSPSGFTAPL